MKRITKILLAGAGAIIFTALNAEISRNVSEYQLNAFYSCYVEFSEKEFSERCRNELDGFGHLTVLSKRS